MEFEQIYELNKKTVYNLTLHYVLNSEDAEDITQEIFVKVYQRLKQFDPAKASLKTWICRIAINHCLDHLKAAKTKKRFAFLTSLFQTDGSENVHALHFNHPGVLAEDREELQQLLEIIYALPEKQKTAIILCRIEDRSQKEVAEIMGISIKAVESLLQRAKEAIRKKIQSNEG